MNHKAGFSGHDAMREKAMKGFSSEMRGLNNMSRDCYKSGGKVHHGRVKKDIGGEIQKAGIMGAPSYLIDKITGGYKSGGKVHQKPVRRNMGGMMGIPTNTADSIQQANQLLSNAASNGVGLKRGGKAHQKTRSKHADGGAINVMGARDFNEGRKAIGFNHGGRADLDGYSSKKSAGFNDGGEVKRAMGGEIKKAIGGAGKIRHGQCSPRGKSIAPKARFKG
jgi:hypothetical protein